MKRENIRGRRCSNQTQFPRTPKISSMPASAIKKNQQHLPRKKQHLEPNFRRSRELRILACTPSQLHVCFLKQPHRAMRVFRRAPCTAMLMTGTGPAPLTWRPAPATMTRARPRSWAVAHASKSSRLASMNGEELAPHRGRKSTG